MISKLHGLNRLQRIKRISEKSVAIRKISVASGSEAGQSLVEILVGLALIALGIGFAVILVFGGQKVLIDRGNALEARTLALEGLEATRSIRERSWDELTDGEYGLVFQNGKWLFFGSSTVSGIFTRKITITTESDDIKKIKSEVLWEAEPLRQEEVEFVTLLTNWRDPTPPPDPGDPGGGGISGDWRNPRTLGSVDLGPGNSATDLDVVNKIVYIVAEASDKKKPDFFVVDATDGASPFIVSSLDSGPSLNAIDVSGNYAYLANRDTNAQLQIIEVSNRNNPTLISSFKLPGVSGSGAVGQTVFYANSKAYVGTRKATGPEFHIVDVTNPANPVSLGSLEVNADVSDIYVSRNTAYIATPDDTEELKILNVVNPSSISQIGSFNIPGEEDGKSLYLIGTKLYFGTLSRGDREFYVLDISSPASVQLLGKAEIEGDVNDIIVRDSLSFLATGDSNREFQVWNISDPANPVFWSSFNFPQVATGIDYEDNLVYVAVRSNDALRIITSSP